MNVNHIPRSWQIGIVATLMVVYILLAAYFHAVLQTSTLHTHLAYLPVTLAAWWWGRRGLVVVPIIGIMIFFCYPFAVCPAEWAGNLVRLLSLTIVGLVLGSLSDRLRASLRKSRHTEQKHLELTRAARSQEEQLLHSTRLAEMGEMAAAVAHELNQPLTAIKNFSKNTLFMIQQDAGDTEEIQDNLRLISDQVSRASKIIKQMRELARREPLQQSPVNINDIIQECTDFLQPQFDLADVHLTLALAADLRPVMGDRVQLGQVVLNLLTNARQAMAGSQQRSLEVSTRQELHQEQAVVIVIRDTGCGFADDDAQRIFTPFFTTKPPGQGTGLGLSISDTIVKDHGGRISATSTVGQGATFTIRLPAHENEAD